MRREYTVVYQIIEDGWIMATVPELPGAVTQGRTMKEAWEMIQEAVTLLAESYREQDQGNHSTGDRESSGS